MSLKLNYSMSLANSYGLTKTQKIASAVGILGLFILVLALFNVQFPNKAITLTIALSLMFIGAIWFSNSLYLDKSKGIKNDGVWFKSLSARGLIGWLIGVVLTLFYIVLYFYPQYLGLAQKGEENTGLVALFDPLSQLLSGRNASQWFVYGTLYTVAILVFGYKFILKYRHNRYEQIRTISVMFFSIGFCVFNSRIYVRNE